MAGNGVASHVADRLLNHVAGTISGVAAVYWRRQFLAEWKAAQEAWATHVVGSSDSDRSSRRVMDKKEMAMHLADRCHSYNSLLSVHPRTA